MNINELKNKLILNINPNFIISNTKIVKIINNENYVELLTQNNNKFKSKYAIVAIPWKNVEKIEFEENLPHQVLSLPPPQIQHKPCYFVTSFIIKFKESFWKLNGFSGNILAHEKFYHFVCYELKPNTLAGLVYHTTINFNEISIRSYVLEKLNKEFCCCVIHKPILWKEKIWSQDPIHLNLPITSPWGHIIWDTKNFANLYRGFLNGKIQSGLYSGLDVLLKLRPQAIQLYDISEIQKSSFYLRRFGFFDDYFKSINFYNTFYYTIVSVCFYTTWKLLRLWWQCK